MTKPSLKQIGENTPITIGLVITLCGGIWWLSAMNSSVKNLEIQLAEVKADVKKLLNKSKIAGDPCDSINHGPYAYMFTPAGR